MNVYNDYLLFNMRHLQKTDYFFSAQGFLNIPARKDGVYELMCHPGNDKVNYQKEIDDLRAFLRHNHSVELINYNEL